jgi:hypothetical protein
MTKNPPGQSCDADRNPVICLMEAVLSIDNRGQIVIPKEVRATGKHPGR